MNLKAQTTATPKPRRRAGFTLIEIVVVLTIVGILSSIAIVNYNRVLAKVEAARIATQLHYIEDAIVEAILDGVGERGFDVGRRPVSQTALGEYLTDANLSDVPEGVRFDIQATRGRRPFLVNVGVESDRSHEAIIEELRRIFPSTGEVTGNGLEYWVSIDSGTLAVFDPKSGSN